MPLQALLTDAVAVQSRVVLSKYLSRSGLHGQSSGLESLDPFRNFKFKDEGVDRKVSLDEPASAGIECSARSAMEKRMNILGKFLFLALSSPAALSIVAQTAQPPQSPVTIITSDTRDVQHVIDAYHEAVLSHDGTRLASLFLSQGGFWLNVLSDDAYVRAKGKSPNAGRIRIGSYVDFAKIVSNPKAALNPTHTNLVIHSDGTIASVYFDFIFLSEGKEQNRGSETWVLVKGDEGWKIAGIAYSSHPHQ